MRSVAGWLGLSALVIALDQLSKLWISAYFALGESLYIAPFFNLVRAHNTGAAFSLFAEGSGWQRWFFSAVALGASILILYLLRRHASEKLFCFALSLILGGALGNLIDRLWLGHVVDFIQLHAAGYYWPAFNVADSAITVGAALLIWGSYRSPERQPSSGQR